MFHSLTIAGRLGKDPVLRTGQQNGTPWVTFSIAVEDRKGQTTWYNVRAFNGTAQACAQYLKKGDFALVEGRPSVDAYTARDGSHRAELAVLANTVRFGPRAQHADAQPATQAPAVTQAAPATPPPPPAPPAPPAPTPVEEPEYDLNDVPF
jgi:single-strand DNA-binding protein